jgi:CDP-diacylglycerol--glycerol-3-phosphate 3-phosphatidyltransferase
MIPWYRKKRFWNLPNTITVMRTIFVPVVVALLWERPDFFRAMIATGVFIVAMLLDLVDGWLARKWDLQSVMGAFLDPLADKLMHVTALIMLIPIGWAPAWMVLVMECRELAITGLRSLAAGEGLVIPASSLGKFKTSYQSTAISFLLLHYPIWGIDCHSVGILLLWISMFMSLASGAEYGWRFYEHYNRRKEAGGTPREM